jgi:hypothetical protein
VLKVVVVSIKAKDKFIHRTINHMLCSPSATVFYPHHNCSGRIKYRMGWRSENAWRSKMTNTYKEDASMEEKMYEEIRCLRCVLERILNHLSSQHFLDYQMEKFGKDYK